MFGKENDIQGMENCGSNRAINRQKFDYQDLEDQISTKTTMAGKILRSLKSLIAVRKTYYVFNPYCGFSILETVPGIFGIKRFEAGNEDDGITALFNFTQSTVRVPMDGLVTNIMTNEKTSENEIALEPLSFGWYL